MENHYYQDINRTNKKTETPESNTESVETSTEALLRDYHSSVLLNHQKLKWDKVPCSYEQPIGSEAELLNNVSIAIKEMASKLT